MATKEKQFVGAENVDKLDAYDDLKRDIAESTEYNKQLHEFGKELLDGNDKLDEEYKIVLLSMISKLKSAEPHMKRTENDDNVPDGINDCFAEDEEADDGVYDNYSYFCSSDEEPDPQFELFFSKLKPDGKSYALVDERDGVPVFIKFEGESSTDEECEYSEEEPRRKLRSSMKQENWHSDDVDNCCEHNLETSSSKETPKNLSGRKSRTKAKTEKIENVKKCSTTVIVPDPEYLAFHQSLTYVDNHFVFTCGGDKVVYWMSDGDDDQKKKEHDDEYFSDIEIIDGTTFYEKRNSSPSRMNKDSISNFGCHTSEFRKQLIDILRKPFDKKEYDKLWLDVEERKPEGRHLELRNGREKSCSTNKDGKSYLDHHPDFGRKLFLYRDDKPKCLNLLRGFFFWLQSFLQDGSFRPWQDEECLSIKPASC